MSTIRVKKDSNNPYVMINKTALQDPNISFKAKGIFAYLISKPDDWKCQVADLVNNGSDGRDSIRSGLKELRKCGYLIKRPIKNELGRIIEWEEILFEIPQDEAKEIYKKQCEKATYGKSVSGKKTRNGKSVSGESTSGKPVPLLSNDNTNNNNTNNYTTQQNIAGSAVKDIIENNTHLLLSKNQIKITSKWNTNRTHEAIKIFNKKGGKFFALLEKIYKDDGNFAKVKVDRFNSFEQREYDFDELERKLLNWD